MCLAMDPLAAAAAWTAITRGGLSFLAFVRDHVKDSGVISAIFDVDGVRTAGDEILVHRFPLYLDSELTQARA